MILTVSHICAPTTEGLRGVLCPSISKQPDLTLTLAHPHITSRQTMPDSFFCFNTLRIHIYWNPWSPGTCLSSANASLLLNMSKATRYCDSPPAPGANGCCWLVHYTLFYGLDLLLSYSCFVILLILLAFLFFVFCYAIFFSERCSMMRPVAAASLLPSPLRVGLHIQGPRLLHTSSCTRIVLAKAAVHAAVPAVNNHLELQHVATLAYQPKFVTAATCFKHQPAILVVLGVRLQYAPVILYNMPALQIR